MDQSEDTPNPSDLSALAQQYFDLWQEQLSDPQTQAFMAESLESAHAAGQKFLEAMQTGAGQDLSEQAKAMGDLMQSWAAFAASQASQTAKTAPQESAHETTASAREDTAHTGDASGVADGDSDDVQSRIDALAQRIATLENDLASKGDGA